MDRQEAEQNKANLKAANLFQANLFQANLEEANLRHVDARYLCLSEKEILFRMDCCSYPVTIWHGVVMIGCKDFSFQEILDMTEEKAEKIHEGFGLLWKRWGDVLICAVKKIQSRSV